MLAGCEVRRRWRSVLALVVLVGVVGAVVLAAAAGARRSATALERFSAASRSGDLSLSPALGYTPTPAQLSALRRVPDVAAVAVLRFYTLKPVDAPAGLSPAAAVDGAMGSVVDRSRLIAGRRANPAAPDEVTIGEILAAQLHRGVGGHIDFLSYTPAQFAAASSGGGSGVPPPSPEGPRVRVRIVGIVRRPGDLGDADAGGGIVVLTPAFNRVYFEQIGNFGVGIETRTRHGASDIPSVFAAARPIFAHSGGVSLQSAAESTGGAQSAIDVLTLALWVVAGVAALAGVVAIGIVLIREISPIPVDQETLRSLGVTRRQRVLMSAPQALVIAAGGGLLAVLGAVAASPLLPVGVARRADPDPGFHIDWIVLVLGVLAVTTVVLLIALIAAFRNTRRSALDATSTRARRRPSRIVERAARAGMAPAAASGLRMALEPGRGRTAVPVRSAYLGAVFGVLGVVAVLVFASSLDHLVATPRLFGSTWDFQARDTNFNPTPTNDGCGRNAFGLTHVSGVGAVAAVCTNDIQLGGDPVTGWGFTPVRGTIEPEIIAGRTPRTSREVALGSVTLDALGKSVGDTVQGRGPRGTAHYRIVGQVAFPKLGDPQALADGAAFTGAGLSRVFDSNNSANRFLLGRFTPGSDHAAVKHRIAALPGLGNPGGSTVPVEVDRLRHIDWLPVTLAALLASLALLAVGHALVTGVRRRRHDLALLKTLGFSRSQVRATVAWQATTLAAVGLAIGIPTGVIVGRVVWSLVANGLGVATTVAIPALAFLITVLVAIALVNLIAYFPGRSAAQTRPAVALRTE